MKYATILFPAMVAALGAKGNTGKTNGGAPRASAIAPAGSSAPAGSAAPAAGGSSTNAGGGEFSLFPSELVDQI